jgi:prophage regulatory protein
MLLLKASSLMTIIDGSAVLRNETSGTELHGVVRILQPLVSELRECMRDNSSACTPEYSIVFCLSAVVIWIIAPLRWFNGLRTYSSLLISGSSTFGGPPAPTVIINRAEVLRRTGLKKSTMYNLIDRGEFPAQIQMTDGTVGWDSWEVENWIQQRKALRDRANGKEGTIPPGGMAVPEIKAHNAGPARPEGKPITGWPAPILSECQVKHLTGQELSKMRSGDARPFFDKLTGRLWVCVLQVNVPRSSNE